MSIAFNTLPDTVRVPFAYAEFDGSGASDDPALMPYTVLMVGQMLDSGTAEAGTVQRPMSAAQAATLFGEGSQLAAMCAAYLNANSIAHCATCSISSIRCWPSASRMPRKVRPPRGP